MKIKLEDIEQMISVLLLRYKEANGNEIEIENDFYWDFASNEIYNPMEEPKDLSLGQLTDDWDTLRHSFLSDNLIPYDLQRISNILKALSIEKPIYT
ncbi:hypothetical protein SAMN05421820_101124 [Pedobacter steynii]|uniref:Uncharacterized protein n=1 Tax=Pedobacter steynii TaxID=430522 RepID=A0A1G9J2C2_9SPHI|nr:hypothetical protein [Pedobacter steynii]NQX38117.1 hypothetical protein [Pedobacter steynii]SDL31485.1 hypothetical protein SAMN05421820_101124 [Pedobacter steynii]